MPDHHFNKIRYQFFKKHLSADLGQVKSNKSCQWITDVHRIGRISDGYWFYKAQDRATILDLIKSQLAVDLMVDDYPLAQSRETIALTHNNEKLNALAVADDFVLVNALNGLMLNQQRFDMTNLSSLGLYLNIHDIESVEHKQIVFVENLTIMANLRKLVLAGNAEHLSNALWVYRGDLKREQSTSRAYDFFRRFKSSHQLIAFTDVDPEGFRIALTSGATQLLAPNTKAIHHFKVEGADQDYFNQTAAKHYVLNRFHSTAQNKSDFVLPEPVLSQACQTLFTVICDLRKTIKQEHILSHQIPISVFEIN